MVDSWQKRLTKAFNQKLLINITFPEEITNVEDSENNTKLLVWLENNIEPFIQVLKYWKLTAGLRFNFSFQHLNTHTHKNHFVGKLVCRTLEIYKTC